MTEFLEEVLDVVVILTAIVGLSLMATVMTVAAVKFLTEIWES